MDERHINDIPLDENYMSMRRMKKQRMTEKIIMTGAYVLILMILCIIISYVLMLVKTLSGHAAMDDIYQTILPSAKNKEEENYITEPEVDIQEEPTQPEPEPEPEPEVQVDQHDLELLACVIYQEAGGDECCDDCRRMVADVVLNRVESNRFPNTIERVLTARRQYGRFYITGVVWPKRASSSSEKYAVDRAYRIAEEVLTGHHSSIYDTDYYWQAEFKQGTDIIECCGTYFGRGDS